LKPISKAVAYLAVFIAGVIIGNLLLGARISFGPGGRVGLSNDYVVERLAFADDIDCRRVKELDYETVSCFLREDRNLVQHGPYLIFNNNRRLITAGYFENGEPQGGWLHFDETGAIVRKGRFDSPPSE